MYNFNHVSTPKNKPIEVIRKYKLETIFEIKKLEMQYMNKTNGKHFKLFKDGLVISSSPFPQGDESSIIIMAKLNKVNGETGVRARGKGF
jgi:hypothetical protein